MSTIIFKIRLPYPVKLKVPVLMTLKSSFKYLFEKLWLIPMKQHCLWEQGFGECLQTGSSPEGPGYQWSKISSKIWFANRSWCKEEKQLPHSNLRPSNNLSTLSETVQYINITCPQLLTPTSIPTSDTPTSLCSLFLSFCFSQHVSLSPITMFWSSLLFTHLPSNLFLFFPLPNCSRLHKTLVRLSYCSDPGKES